MNELMLFTDGSVDNKTKVGYGAYLFLTHEGLSPDALSVPVKVRRFEHTSSTKLELQTLLWALGDIKHNASRVTIYTDSQNIMGLEGRRERLEQNDYCSKKKRLLKNHELYREFYSITDGFDCTFVKVRGHKVSNEKDGIDRIFTLVDKASRAAMREGSG